MGGAQIRCSNVTGDASKRCQKCIFFVLTFGAFILSVYLTAVHLAQIYASNNRSVNLSLCGLLFPVPSHFTNWFVFLSVLSNECEKYSLKEQKNIA